MTEGRISTKTRQSRSGFEVWGLTGGIAAGKSLVAGFLAEQGLSVIDADSLARELGSPGGAAHAAIVQRFGTDDRMRLRNLVFNDSGARQDLEAILHPLIQAESLRRMQELARQGIQGPFIYEAALLVETRRYRLLEGLIVVEAPRESRVERLIARDLITIPLAERMIDAQLGDPERREVATEVIENSGTPGELRARVEELVRRRHWR